MRKGKIAIMFADAGLGHRRDAYNLYSFLKQKNFDVILFNFSDPEIIGRFYSFLWDLAKKAYEFFQRKLLIKHITKSPLTNFAMQFYSFLISNRIKSFLKNNKISLLISTHPLPLIDLSYKKNLRTKLINLVPDSLNYLSVWFYLLPGDAFYFVNDDKTKEILIKSGVKENKIFVIGHIMPFKETKISIKRIEERIKNIKRKKPLFFVTTGGAGTNEKEMKRIIKYYLKIRKGKLFINCNQHLWLFNKLSKGGKIIRKEEIKFKKNSIGLIYSVSFNKSIIKFLISVGKNEEEKRKNAIIMFNKFFSFADIFITKPSELAFYSCGIPMLLFSPTNIVERTNIKTVLNLKYSLKFKSKFIFNPNLILKDIKFNNFIFYKPKKLLKVIKKIMD